MPDVFTSIEAAFKAGDLDRVEALLWPALDQYPYESRLWFYGGCIFFKKGQCAVSAQVFQRAVELEDSPHIYSNLGASYRRLNMHEEGIHVLKSALERDPDYQPTLVNLGSMYVNEGCPELGIPHLEKAVSIGIKSGNLESGAVWNLGLLNLEAGKFAEGFNLYRQGVNAERAVRCYGAKDGSIPEPALMTPELLEVVRASGTKPKLIVWGEQGIGDELMFGTILKDAQQDFEVIFECHPRLERLHRNAHDGMKLYPTRKEGWINWPITDNLVAEYKAAIGDLGCYYRRDLQDFRNAWAKHGPTYHANPVEAASYRIQLEVLANGRPIVGLATRGGVVQTSRTYRTIRLLEIDQLISNTDALYVSLDYDDMLDVATHIEKTHGPDRYRWFPSILHHYDYDHTAALVAACDVAVSVCQSVIHIAAHMGHPTIMLAPIRVAWREISACEDPEEWYWAPDPAIRIYRQKDTANWQAPIGQVIEYVNELTKLKREAA